jgi:Na+-transporting methylmalonyl-CoA/oxaloacetate decarboxylase beta subunit
MGNKKKKIIFLIILAVVLISTVTSIGYLASKSNVLTANVTIVGGDDGPTTIYISSSIPPWLILINSLIIISIDLVILNILDTIKHIKKIEISKLRYKIINVFIVNLLISIIIIPNMVVFSILIAVGIVIFLFVKNKFRKENDKNEEGQTA